MKVAIVGSREYGNLNQVKLYVADLPPGTTVVSGGATGVDKAAETAAKACGLEVEIYPAEWDKYGKKAGFVRNRLIVEAADRVVTFWDGQSRGTANTMGLAIQMGKKLEVYGSREGQK